jgi:hypothetical protein
MNLIRTDQNGNGETDGDRDRSICRWEQRSKIRTATGWVVYRTLFPVGCWCSYLSSWVSKLPELSLFLLVGWSSSLDGDRNGRGSVADKRLGGKGGTPRIVTDPSFFFVLFWWKKPIPQFHNVSINYIILSFNGLLWSSHKYIILLTTNKHFSHAS